MPDVDAPTTLDELLRVPLLGERLTRLRTILWSGSEGNALWVGAGYSALVASLPSWSQFLSSASTKIADTEEKAFATAMLKQGRLRLAAEHIADQLGFNLHRLLRATFALQSHPTHTSNDLIDPRWATTIVTTNYDLLLDTSLGMFSRVSVRNPDDLFNPGSKLVKIHGSIDDPETCVVSIKHYSRAYDGTLEWFLFFLFQSKSVFFLGTSLDKSEPWVPILGKLRRLYPPTKGSNAHPPHFALLAVRDSREAVLRGKALESEFGILTIPYIPDYASSVPHAVVNKIMEYLAIRPEATEMMSSCEDHVLRQAEELFAKTEHESQNAIAASAGFTKRRATTSLGAVEWIIRHDQQRTFGSRCCTLAANVIYELLGEDGFAFNEEFNGLTLRMQQVVRRLDWSREFSLVDKIATLLDRDDRSKQAPILAPMALYMMERLDEWLASPGRREDGRSMRIRNMSSSLRSKYAASAN